MVAQCNQIGKVASLIALQRFTPIQTCIRKVVVQWPWNGHSRRPDDHGQKLKHLQPSGIHAEREDIFVAKSRMILWQARNIGRVIQEPSALQSHIGRIVLTDARKARVARQD